MAVNPRVGLNTTGGPLGERRDPYHAFNFTVEIHGLICAGFSSVQGLESSISTEDRVEGGVNGYVHKLLKETTFPELVLSHGLTDLDTLWAWYERTSRGVIERKHGSVMLLDAAGSPVMWWEFRDALPIKCAGPSFDAEQDKVAVESLTLVHRGLSRSSAR
jgi:phage tail-like protein